jgi:hypothetical protein
MLVYGIKIRCFKKKIPYGGKDFFDKLAIE